MTDRDFLELFNKIDDKFLEEAQHDQRKYRIGKRHIFNVLSTTAACMALVVSAVLLVSSFIDGGLIRLPNNSSYVQSGSNNPADAASGTTSENSVTPPARLPDIGYSRLSFTSNEVDLGLTKADYYAVFGADEACTVSAEFEFTVTCSDCSLNNGIPMRMYIFADDRPTEFKYRNQERLFREFTVDPEKKYSLPVSFNASADVNTISIVCILCPGDPDRQNCFIQTAGNVYGTKEIIDDAYIPDGYIDYNDTQRGCNFVTLTSDPNTVPVYTVSGLKNDVIPADSAYLFASFAAFDAENSDTSDTNPNAPDMYYIIALMDGKPVNISDNGDPFCLGGDLLKKEVYYRYKIPEENLPENSTIQIIALPTEVNSWRDSGFNSICYRVV